MTAHGPSPETGNRSGSRRLQASGLYATMLKPRPPAVAATEGPQTLMLRSGHQRRSKGACFAAGARAPAPSLRPSKASLYAQCASRGIADTSYEA